MENKYTHVERLTSPETEDLLNGICYFYPKLDGANASVEYKNGKVIARSRNSELYEETHLRGFYKYIQDRSQELEEFFENFPDFIVFGEWLVPHTIQTYQKDAWNKFYVYDFYDKKTQKYLDFETFRLVVEGLSDFEFVPLLGKFVKPTSEQIEEILNNNSYKLESGVGEGIVVKNYQFVNKYGRSPFAKVVNEHFKNSHTAKFKEPTELFERDLVYKYLTAEYVLKEVNKLEDQTKVAEAIHIVYNEFVRDFISEILQKYKNPTINFHELKKYVAKYVVATML